MSETFEWEVSDAPKTTQLTGVESHEGTVVASGKRGLLAKRTAPGEWEALFNAGPTGNGHGILDAAFTADGKRVWYCGNSGSFGYYDRAQQTTKSHQGPSNVTSAFQSVCVMGDAGEETVVAADDNGQLVRVSMDGESMTVEGVRTPGQGTAFTEVVHNEGERYAADASGFLYYSPDGERWRRKRLVADSIKSLAAPEAGLAAITSSGTVYRDISLFGEGRETKKADFGTTSPEELAAAGEVFVIGGCDGCVVPIMADTEANHVEPGPGVTYYGAEITEDGTIVAAGSSGTIVEGTPT